METSNVPLIIDSQLLDPSDVYVNGRKFVPAEPNPFGSQIALAGCKHLHLSKVANMNPTTYRCEACHDLFDVTLAPVAQPEPVFPARAGEIGGQG